MAYTRQYTQGVGWQNEPSTATPINATNLNQMDNAIKNVDAAVAAAFAEVSGLTYAERPSDGAITSTHTLVDGEMIALKITSTIERRSNESVPIISWNNVSYSANFTANLYSGMLAFFLVNTTNTTLTFLGAADQNRDWHTGGRLKCTNGTVRSNAIYIGDIVDWNDTNPTDYISTGDVFLVTMTTGGTLSSGSTWEMSGSVSAGGAFMIFGDLYTSTGGNFTHALSAGDVLLVRYANVSNVDTFYVMYYSGTAGGGTIGAFTVEGETATYHIAGIWSVAGETATFNG